MSDTAVYQDDLMTQFLAANPQVGRLIWFTVDDGPVDQNAWLQGIVDVGLASYGTPPGVPATTAYLRGLRAMQQAVPSRTLVRCVERERGRTVHHWIKETIVNGHVDFRALAAIERRTTGTPADVINTRRLDTLSASEDEALGRLQTYIDTARAMYTPGDRRRQVRRWLANAGALQMVAAGPVQFVPEGAAGLIEAMSQAQETLGMQIWSMPLTRSSDVVATLTQSLDAEVTRKTAALLKSVQEANAAGKTPTLRQQTKVVEQMQDLDARVQHYASMLGTEMDVLTDQIGLAKKAVRGMLIAQGSASDL